MPGDLGFSRIGWIFIGLGFGGDPKEDCVLVWQYNGFNGLLDFWSVKEKHHFVLFINLALLAKYIVTKQLRISI